MSGNTADIGKYIEEAQKCFPGLSIATASHRVAHAIRISKEIMFLHEVRHFNAADVVAAAALILEHEARARAENGAGKPSV